MIRIVGAVEANAIKLPTMLAFDPRQPFLPVPVASTEDVTEHSVTSS